MKEHDAKYEATRENYRGISRALHRPIAEKFLKIMKKIEVAYKI